MKIPTVCQALGVPCVRTFAMLRGIWVRDSRSTNPAPDDRAAIAGSANRRVAWGDGGSRAVERGLKLSKVAELCTDHSSIFSKFADTVRLNFWRLELIFTGSRKFAELARDHLKSFRKFADLSSELAEIFVVHTACFSEFAES